MHIVAISGSPRPGSVSSQILNVAGNLLGSTQHFTIYEALLELPHFSPDLDTEPADLAVMALRILLREADGVIICTPEYAFSMPSVLKNALEWIVSSGEMNEMPVLSISTSPLPPGGEYAHTELRMVLKALGARSANENMLCIGATRKKISPSGGILDAAITEKIREEVIALTKLMHNTNSEHDTIATH
ncbi:MAG: NADPH-dependent FMN reductase [Bacteroidota bacterium]|nr:NADPH-dependent FMN reductase [Bacteroidota bacterium]MDP4229100.1 NADPH-dependent FMN reductase [Bacteroidota bacterium]MDP4235026.1 NADPH-dependent FMN reductase [Bacteroidota bacterium]